MSLMLKLNLWLLLAILPVGLFAETEKIPVLSFFGAQLSGNEEGSIPPWQGGIVTPPANYKPGDWHPDPFASDASYLLQARYRALLFAPCRQ